MKCGIEFKDMCGTKCWDLFYIERGLNMFIGILQTSWFVLYHNLKLQIIG